jgi:hypothetical protein
MNTNRKIIPLAMASGLVLCALACKGRVYDAQQAGNDANPTPSDSAAPDGAAASTHPDTQAQSQMEDSVITARVRTVLASDPALKGSVIQVETRGGTVSLNGTVLDRTQRHAAENAALRIQGVRNVNNLINVKR